MRLMWFGLDRETHGLTIVEDRRPAKMRAANPLTKSQWMAVEMQRSPGIAALIALLIGAFLYELACGAVGNQNALLVLGALPGTGDLHGEGWRLITYALLHLTALHLVLNAATLWWVGRM